MEKFGLTLDMVQLPLSSRPIEEAQSPNILLGKDPERQRELDSICRLIERIGAAGIPAAKYNFNIIGIPRTAHEAGRGGSRNAAFRWSDTDQSASPGRAGAVERGGELGAHRYLPRGGRAGGQRQRRYGWRVIRTIPTRRPATRASLACLARSPGCKRFVTMHESPYHGLNFCQGTVAEMLDDPEREIDDVIRWFGTRGKLFNVHFRNIRGRKLDFMEAFPDEGDMDMARSLRVYREIGYQYMLMPDHVPEIDGRDPSGTAFAFCYGYIRGLLDATAR